MNWSTSLNDSSNYSPSENSSQFHNERGVCYQPCWRKTLIHLKRRQSCLQWRSRRFWCWKANSRRRCLRPLLSRSFLAGRLAHRPRLRSHLLPVPWACVLIRCCHLSLKADADIIVLLSRRIRYHKHSFEDNQNWHLLEYTSLWWVSLEIVPGAILKRAGVYLILPCTFRSPSVKQSLQEESWARSVVCTFARCTQHPYNLPSSSLG